MVENRLNVAREASMNLVVAFFIQLTTLVGSLTCLSEQTHMKLLNESFV